MVMTSTLLCDRKRDSAFVALRRLVELTYPDTTIYVNIETNDFNGWGDVLKFLEDSGRPFHYDFWTHKSSWAGKPAFDQDQARLHPICIARNMSIQAAMGLGASHIFQVDADVVVPVDSIERLLALDRPLVGGLVPGRGAHMYAQYLSHIKSNVNGIVECEYATCGFALVRHDLFSVLKYRSGPHNTERNVMLSEDPAYGTDAHDRWGVPWWTVDTNLRAEHIDSPHNPLTLDQVAQF